MQDVQCVFYLSGPYIGYESHFHFFWALGSPGFKLEKQNRFTKISEPINKKGMQAKNYFGFADHFMKIEKLKFAN